jgi:hypothetical protein
VLVCCAGSRRQPIKWGRPAAEPKLCVGGGLFQDLQPSLRRPRYHRGAVGRHSAPGHRVSSPQQVPPSSYLGTTPGAKWNVASKLGTLAAVTSRSRWQRCAGPHRQDDPFLALAATARSVVVSTWCTCQGDVGSALQFWWPKSQKRML